MANYKSNASLDEMNEYAMDLFHKGFTCAEATMYTLKKYYPNLPYDEKSISMSSTFPWGLGGGGCLCGALAGGEMILGSIYGRKSFDETRTEECFDKAKVLHDKFKELNGATCCRVLMKGLERNDPKRKENCSGYVKNTIKIMKDLIESA